MAATNIYTEILNLSEAGIPAVMATVVQKAGSSPGPEGARCLLSVGKVVFGSVGGGRVEAEACAASSRVNSTGRPLKMFFKLDGTDAAETDMLCGGEVTLFLEPAAPVHPGDRALFERLGEITSGGGRGVVATALDEDRWLPGGGVPKILVERDGRVTGTLRPAGVPAMDPDLDLEHLLRGRGPEMRRVEDEAGRSITLFMEPVGRRAALYVFGGGHVSRALVPAASMVDFHVTVVDDRAEYSKPGDFPQADRVLLRPFENVFEGLKVDEDSFLVIATRGHVHDMTVLIQALRSDACYIGMVGSSRKREAIFRRLLDRGFTESDLSRVHTPVGLDIGAETPAEIAVSIVAELVEVRSGGIRRRKVS